MVMQVHDELVFDFPVASAADRFFKSGKGNLTYIKSLQRLMEEGGNDFGIPTPVGIEYHENNWAEGVEV
jgi:DNA polymerase I-like protein with 3'-5' exonuclease and polymerase domains